MVTRKVTAGIVSNGLITVVCWVLRQFYQIEVPGDAAVGAATVVTGLIQYFVPNAE